MARAHAEGSIGVVVRVSKTSSCKQMQPLRKEKSTSGAFLVNQGSSI